MKKRSLLTLLVQKVPVLVFQNSFKCQYMAIAGAGAEIMAKVGTGAENKKFRLRNTAQLITR